MLLEKPQLAFSAEIFHGIVYSEFFFFFKLFALDIWFFKPFKKISKTNWLFYGLPDQQCEPEEGRLFNGFVLLGLGLMIVQKSVFQQTMKCLASTARAAV